MRIFTTSDTDVKVSFRPTLGRILIWLGLALSVGGLMVPLAAFTAKMEAASAIVLTLGYVLWAIDDWRENRRFQWMALFLLSFVLFAIAVITPVMISAAVASSKGSIISI